MLCVCAPAGSEETLNSASTPAWSGQHRHEIKGRSLISRGASQLEQNHDYEHTCTRYLLGELTEAEQTQFEEAYFVDDLLFERFLAVKDDLVDSYVRHELAGRERERFEQHFLANQPRRERLNDATE